jgi:tripeptidyl-peptidase-1
MRWPWSIALLFFSSPLNTCTHIGVTESFQSDAYVRGEEVQGQEPVTWLIGLLPFDGGTQLSRVFQEVSDPTHANYGRHLSREEADNLTRASPRALEEVSRWLTRSRGCLSYRYLASVNLLEVRSHAHQLRRLLNTTLHQFHHLHSPDHRFLRASSALRIPREIVPHLAYTSLTLHAPPLGAFSSASPPRSLSAQESVDNISPQILRELYRIPSQLRVLHPRSSQSAAEFFDENWSPDDLALFYRETNESLLPSLIQTRGSRPNDPTKPSSEASLDVQFLSALAPGAPTTVWTVAGLNPNSTVDEPFVAWAHEVLSLESPPLVHSMSYSDDEEHVFGNGGDWVRSMDLLLQKMAVRGLSVLFASGDDGVSGLKRRQFGASVKEACGRSHPQWPSSSAFVTSVGATQFVAKEEADDFFNNYKLEVVCAARQGGHVTSGGVCLLSPLPSPPPANVTFWRK